MTTEKLQHALDCVLCKEHQSAPVLMSAHPEEEPCLLCLSKQLIEENKRLRGVLNQVADIEYCSSAGCTVHSDANKCRLCVRASAKTA